MKPQEIELWARDIIESVLNGQPVEDSRVELKAKWIEAEKAAPRLGGHANASRGENILWLIGVDERNSSLTTVDAAEIGDWYKSVEKHFDGFAPRLLLNVNVKKDGKTVVALYFDTATEAPFVIKSKNSGSYPEYIVPWREGTMLKAARRENLLRMLIPNYRITALISELEINNSIWKFAKSGASFHSVEFLKAKSLGVINELPKIAREKIIESYVAMEVSNKNVERFMERTNLGLNELNIDYRFELQALEDDLGKTLKKIVRALSELKKISKM